MKRRLFTLLFSVAFVLLGCAGSVPRSAPPTAPGAPEGAAVPAPELVPEPETAGAPPSPIDEMPAAAHAGAVKPTPRPTAPAPVMAVALTPAKTTPATAAAPERYISLNFDNADIAVVIQTIAELLHMNYIVAPTVRGRVSIQTSEKLPVSSLLPVLEQILEVNGFMAVKSGDFFKIVPSNQAKQESVEAVAQEQEPVAVTGLVTKIVQLRFISPGEVIKILTPFKSAAGLYQAHEPSRLVFLTEVPAKIAELMKIVEVLDVDTFASIQVELYPVRYAVVEDLARELNQVVTQVFTAAGRGRSLFRIIPVPQVNAIMVFSGERGLTASIREWIGKLDQPATEANERIFVYPLSHANADTLAAVIERVFRRDGARSQPASAPAAAVPAVPRAAAPRPPAAAPSPQPVSMSGGAAAAGTAPVTVVSDKDTNTLIIQTTAWFYPTVEEMIRKLDAMPKQVLIEVMIAEITLDDKNQFGLSWAFKGQGPVNVLGEQFNLTNSVGSSLGKDLGGLAQSPNGLSIMLTEANRITAVLNAYAHDSKLNILSAPHILATNNKEAKIDVGAEIPILKTMTTPATGSGVNATAATFTNDVEYRSTGVILTVTPHINEGGFVTLDVQQEVSEVQDALTTTGLNSPTIRKRMAKTTMVVKDNQTLVVGGLIQEKRDNSRDGLPWLSKIPIIGFLFGSTSATVTKTELVVLITPRVVNNVAEGDALTKEIRERVLTLKKGLERFPGIKTGEGTAP